MRQIIIIIAQIISKAIFYHLLVIRFKYLIRLSITYLVCSKNRVRSIPTPDWNCYSRIFWHIWPSCSPSLFSILGIWKTKIAGCFGIILNQLYYNTSMKIILIRVALQHIIYNKCYSISNIVTSWIPNNGAWNFLIVI